MKGGSQDHTGIDAVRRTNTTLDVCQESRFDDY